MISLKDFLFKNTYIDCHYHGFGRDGIKVSPGLSLYYINNDIKYDEPLYDYFKEFLENHHVKYYGIVGKDVKDTSKILSDFGGCVLGEIKAYKKCIDSEGVLQEHRDIEFLEGLCKLDNNLPIVVHYDLTWDNYKELESIIEKYQSRKFVLCHCGMNELFDQDDAFKISKMLQARYSNLWLDISWVALKYFENNLDKFANLDNCRLLLGSDNNHLNQEYNIEPLSKHINNEINLKMLLGE